MRRRRERRRRPRPGAGSGRRAPGAGGTRARAAAAGSGRRAAGTRRAGARMPPVRALAPTRRAIRSRPGRWMTPGAPTRASRRGLRAMGPRPVPATPSRAQRRPRATRAGGPAGHTHTRMHRGGGRTLYEGVALRHGPDRRTFVSWPTRHRGGPARGSPHSLGGCQPGRGCAAGGRRARQEERRELRARLAEQEAAGSGQADGRA